MTNEAEVVNENGKVDDGVYCAGWIATGPTGVIVDTMTSLFQVARTILADLESGRVSGTKSGRGFDGVRDILRKEHRIVRNFSQLGKDRHYGMRTRTDGREAA